MSKHTALLDDRLKSILSVRVSAEERALLEAASEQARTNLSDFVRRRALEAAELELLQRGKVVIPADAWEAFEAWVAAPPKANPGLQELARRKLTWAE